MTWINACATTDIDAEDVIRFDHNSCTFIIVRDHQDGYWCADGLCTHEDIHLCDGLVVEGTILPPAPRCFGATARSPGAPRV